MKTASLLIMLGIGLTLHAQVNLFKSESLSPPLFTASPATFTSGDITLSFSLDLQNPNKLFAGPSSGVTDLAPTFRSLVIADVPFAVNTTDNQPSIAGAKKHLPQALLYQAPLEIPLPLKQAASSMMLATTALALILLHLLCCLTSRRLHQQ